MVPTAPPGGGTTFLGLGVLETGSISPACSASDRVSAHYQRPSDLHLPGLNPQRHRDPERRPLVRSALDPDRPAQQVGELAADRQAEARAAVGAGDGAVDLAELFEDHLLLVRRDAG